MSPVAEEAAAAPLVVDLGKRRRKLVRQLLDGQGKLMEEMNETIQELKTAGTISASAQPVIVVVRQKRKARNRLFA
jgi:uncharacterized protein DUF6200